MDDFKNIAVIAQKASRTTDLTQKLRVARQLEVLLRSAIVSIRIQIKEQDRD